MYFRYTITMQLLEMETISKSTPTDCSAKLVEVVPILIRKIRGEMRRSTLSGLSHSHLRTLSFLKSHPRASLSELAVFLGLTLPSTSKLIQNLVTLKVVTRRRATDRRRVCLSLTNLGIAAYHEAQLKTQNQLAKNLNSLTPKELATISEALTILYTAFSESTAGVDLP